MWFGLFDEYGFVLVVSVFLCVCISCMCLLNTYSLHLHGKILAFVFRVFI